MRPRAVVAVTLLLAPLGAGACVDLFHGTGFETACDRDAKTPGCFDAGAPDDTGPVQVLADASPRVPTDFCQWDPATAAQNARRACAWLGACEGVFGGNALGPCVMQAELAYDCNANPDRKVLGATHAYWDCLSQVTSCSDVRACVAPGNDDGCQGDSPAYEACDTTTGTFIACGADVPNESPPLGIEACIAGGQTCASATTTCGGSTHGCAAAPPACDGNGILHDCDPDGGVIDDAGAVLDRGVDCTNFGGGACAPGAAACLATTDDGGTCTPTSMVTCNGSVATGCPSGVPEQVDCNAVFGLTNGVACDPNAPGRPWDVARACSLGACQGPDTCLGSIVSSCVRGVIVQADCKEIGYPGCTTAAWPGEPFMRAQCSTTAVESSRARRHP